MYQVTIEKLEPTNDDKMYNRFSKEEVYTQVFDQELDLSEVVKKLNE